MKEKREICRDVYASAFIFSVKVCRIWRFQTLLCWFYYSSAKNRSPSRLFLTCKWIHQRVAHETKLFLEDPQNIISRLSYFYFAPRGRKKETFHKKMKTRNIFGTILCFFLVRKWKTYFDCNLLKLNFHNTERTFCVTSWEC